MADEQKQAEQDQQDEPVLQWDTSTHGPLNEWNHGQYEEVPEPDQIQVMGSDPDGNRVPFTTDQGSGSSDEQASGDEEPKKAPAKKAAASEKADSGK